MNIIKKLRASIRLNEAVVQADKERALKSGSDHQRIPRYQDTAYFYY